MRSCRQSSKTRVGLGIPGMGIKRHHASDGKVEGKKEVPSKKANSFPLCLTVMNFARLGRTTAVRQLASTRNGSAVSRFSSKLNHERRSLREMMDRALVSAVTAGKLPKIPRKTDSCPR